jgi:hypothetical protein
MKRLSLILASLAFSIGLSGAARAQVVAGLDGRWGGGIDTRDGPLPMVVRIIPPQARPRPCSSHRCRARRTFPERLRGKDRRWR